MWCSHVNIKYQHYTFVCDVHMWFVWFPCVMLACEVRYMMLVCDVGVWCWYMMLIYDFTCEHIRCWCVNSVHDNHTRFSSLITCRSACDHMWTLLKIFILPKYRTWHSHVNIFTHDVHMWTLFPMRCPWMLTCDHHVWTKWMKIFQNHVHMWSCVDHMWSFRLITREHCQCSHDHTWSLPLPFLTHEHLMCL